MSRYKCKLVDKSGTRKHKLTITLRSCDRLLSLRDALRKRIYQRLQHGKYRDPFEVFWKGWILLEYHRV